MIEQNNLRDTNQRETVPIVSIGMPVYNGVPYVQRALDALLAQDYPDFELIISDNASTDETQAICLDTPSGTTGSNTIATPGTSVLSTISTEL